MIEWRKIEKHLLERITELSVDLENPRLDQLETQYVRGQITAARDLLEFKDNKPRAFIERAVEE